MNEPMNVLDISVEKYREYVLSDGTTYRIDAPYRLYTKEGSTSHRVEDYANVVHYIPAGWKIIRWVGNVIA